MRFLRALMVAGVTAGLLTACGGSDGTRAIAAAPHEWERLPDWPLGGRNGVTAVWTGEEVLAIGGSTYSCPPGASCVVRDDEPRFSDGAALDIDSGRWHAIADAPVPVVRASSAVIGDDVYLLASTDFGDGTALLRYRVSDDAWDELGQAPKPGIYELTAAGDTLVAVAQSHEQQQVDDLAFDPATGSWNPLPPSPLGAGFDRGAVWADDHLYLFDHELVPQPNSERPSIVRAARLDLARRTWERLPDSKMLGWDPTWWLVDGGRIINPAVGCADGGDVNGWGRSYPYGGILDIATDRWHDLPVTAPECDPTRPEAAAGAVGSRSAFFVAPHGKLFDATTDTWRDVPQIPGDADSERTIVTADRDAVALGRSIWIWRS